MGPSEQIQIEEEAEAEPEAIPKGNGKCSKTPPLEGGTGTKPMCLLSSGRALEE
jgi:hypothetical protein